MFTGGEKPIATLSITCFSSGTIVFRRSGAMWMISGTFRITGPAAVRPAATLSCVMLTRLPHAASRVDGGGIAAAGTLKITGTALSVVPAAATLVCVTPFSGLPHVAPNTGTATTERKSECRCAPHLGKLKHAPHRAHPQYTVDTWNSIDAIFLQYRRRPYLPPTPSSPGSVESAAPARQI